MPSGSEAATPGGTADDVEGVLPARSDIHTQEAQSRCTRGDLGVLGQLAKPRSVSVCEEAGPLWPTKPLRFFELRKLLNATPLGPVLNERQLYRHRQRAEHEFTVGRRIDLLRYVAWLVTERHVPSPKPRVNGRAICAKDILQMLQDQNFRCALTGRELMPETAALDHIEPISRGGEHVIGNVQILRKEVNRAKHTCTNEEFVEMCREVVKWAEEAGGERG